MKMNVHQFKENLLLYGADLNRWPEEVRRAGWEAIEHSLELQLQVAEHERFERMLTTRKYEGPSGDLELRIIQTSLRHKEESPFSLREFISELFGEFFVPRPAFTVLSISMIFVLVAGFAIGFSDPLRAQLAEEDQTSLQEFLYDEGEVL
jgi:hypothetical protein